MKVNKKNIILIVLVIITLGIAVPTLAKYVLQNNLEKTLSIPEILYYSGTEEAYEYTGDYQVYVAPEDGEYFIELWGAQGGGNSPGNGAYTSGYIRLSKGEKLYVYVGSQGETGDKGISGSGGYNGGGNGGEPQDALYDGGHGGGGATDVRLVSGSWDNLTSLKSRIMVAAGGGGGYGWDNGGAAGGLEGYNTVNSRVIVATQTSTSFGKGENGISKTEFASQGAEGNCGGGGGYYGGGASSQTGEESNAGGGGGSSFISGHDGCLAINEDGTAASNSIHYSTKYFYNTTMIDGQGYNWTTIKGDNIGVPTTDGTETSAGNTGDGYAKIKLVESIEYSNLVEEYAYTGSSKEYIAPETGNYLIQLWGASGGGSDPGAGGYTSGYIYLTRGEKIYVYVGSQGGTEDNGKSGGYNGGGTGGSAYSTEFTAGYGGGGATDVRIVSGDWNDITSLRSRIMVAAGGGGGYGWDNAGAAGGLEGYNTVNSRVTVATQTSTSFGIGENGVNKEGIWGTSGAEGNCGGGGGYYGGGASSQTGEESNAGGGGGSSFISGHEGCNAINEDGTHNSTSVHYSNKTFFNTIMIDGQGYNWTTTKGDNVGVPTIDGTGTTEGNIGDGYAKITYQSNAS